MRTTAIWQSHHRSDRTHQNYTPAQSGFVQVRGGYWLIGQAIARYSNIIKSIRVMDVPVNS
ncbi:MAG TPA: hypothetical protein VK211_16710 [Kamptonema sp.]|nr:hypothetical protein [Kamptonema sp.]